MADKMVCTNCEMVDFPKRLTRGSLGLELLLWILFLVPGVIYSIWRLANRYDACPRCKTPSMVPVDSPRGRRIAETV